jgi:photosystem II stability/assembly factor-like uncharacterized protein
MRVRIWVLLHLVLLLFVGLASSIRGQPLGPPAEPPAPLRQHPSPVPARTKVIALPKRIILQKSLLSPAGAVSKMKLLSAKEGWAVTSGPAVRALMVQHLWWTTNGGMRWRDITPPIPPGAVISSVFVLDARRGWAVLVHSHGENAEESRPSFDLASTDNAGATWSVQPITIPAPTSRMHLVGAASLAFADRLHGLLGVESVDAAMSALSHGYGPILETSDGGRNWQVDTAGPVTSMLLVTPKLGWLLGGPDSELGVTRDGGRSWQEVELKPPVETDQMRRQKRSHEEFERDFRQRLEARSRQTGRQLKPPPYRPYEVPATYDLPTFTDPRHGYVCVSYPQLTVLFQTDDGGVTWTPDSVLTGLKESSQGQKIVSTVADGEWITARVPRDGPPELRKLGPGGHPAAGAAKGWEEWGPSRPLGTRALSFVTPKQGWLSDIYGRLLLTTDGGARWTDITPGRPPHAVAP